MAEDWIAERIKELRDDPKHQRKVARIRAAVADGSFVGEEHTRADLERLSQEGE